MSHELERALREARATLPLPSQRATARARALVLGRAHLRLRLTLAAAALVLATLAGIGVGLWVAPSGGAAEPEPTGLGFLPVPGWTIVQTGSLSPLNAATAVAANVRLHAEDLDGGLPYRTLQSLPAHGIVITASFTAAAPGSNRDYPRATLPLRMRDFPVDQGWSAQARPGAPLAQRNRRVSVGGFNLNVHVYFGVREPSDAALDAAQRQLERLTAASEPVTLWAAQSLLPPGQRPSLFGAVDSARAGERVEIHARECGSQYFRSVGEATTLAGGRWAWQAHFFNMLVTTTFRARWKNSTSSPVVVRLRPRIQLMQHRSTRARWYVGVLGQRPLVGKRLRIERYDARGGRWVRVATVTLRERSAAYAVVWSTADFRATVPRGVQVRAVLPLDQARPCYAGAVSMLVRAR